MIAGRVVDSDGDPVMGEKIVAARYVYDIGKHKRDLCTMAHAWTDDLGRFRIFALPPGRYYLRVSTHSMNGDPWRMQREAAASGRVAVPSFYPGTTDPAKAQAINIAAGEERADIEMTMLKLPVYCARGTVTSPEGKPASDVNVEMTMEMADNSRPTQSSRTNAEGRFEVCGLVAGSYIVQAWLPGIVGQGEAEVADQNVDGLVLRLGHPVKVSGTVVVAGRPGWVWRSPQIILDPIGTRGEPMGTAIRNGIFEFNHVLPGHYRAMTEVDGTYVQSVRFGGKLVTDTGAEIQAGVPPGSLDIVLGVASAEVSGVVRDANAQPVRGATVLLVPPPEFRDDNLRFRYAMSDNDGRYRLSSLPPGKYKLFALNDVDETIWRDPEFLKSIEGKGTAVSLMQDAKTSSDLTLIAVEESK